MNIGNIKGIIFDIQRFSVHDGPGIRTIVFMNGCPLKCLWCHNPESQKMQPQILFEKDLCTLCGECVKICPHGVHAIIDDTRIIQRELCGGCGKCTDNCLTGALGLKGKLVTVDDVISEVLKDRVYYVKSGGGITLSGGEPLTQPVFAKALLIRSKEHGINTAIETSGYARWNTFEEILDLVDFTMYDIKLVDSGLHKRYCGAGNSLIIKNLKRIIEKGKTIHVRVPLIPAINDTDENLKQTAELLTGLGMKYVELIPYHAFAKEKCRALGIDYPLSHSKTQTRKGLKRMMRLMSSLGIEAKIGV